jgi:8-oxo-dGTP pyrophosphatase MutT (NUDIX family)
VTLPLLTFLATGDWAPHQVRISRAVSSQRWDSDVSAMIDAAWARAAGRPGVHLFDGPMCRLESWRAAPAGLELAVSPTSYKPFLGTNLVNPHLADRYGTAVLANPLGVSAALVTADDFLLLGRRNAAVAYYPSRVHPFAGALEPADGGGGDAPDPFAAAYRELGEELNLSAGDVSDLRCAGLVEDAHLRQPELVFRARTPLTRAEVESRLDPAEHHGLWSAPLAPGDFDAALRDPALTPVAIGSVLLWGRAAFGDEWWRAVLS